MLRALVFATLLGGVPNAVWAQSLSVLHITVVVLDTDGRVTPVPRHALLISDNPSTTAPRRVFTRPDGTVDVRLRPGNYTVESDQPLAFHGNAYEWRRTLDVAEGEDVVIEFTADNAVVESITSAPDASSRADLSTLLVQWQDSVVAIWTPTTRASGFVVGANGLVVTNQRAIGSETSVEVQLTSAVKVRGSVLVADVDRDVAIIRIDPKALGSVRPVPLGCASVARPSPATGQEISVIGAPLRRFRDVAFGTISGVETHTIASDVILPIGSEGGPVFSAGGDVIGITSADETDERGRGDARIVRVDDVCDVVAVAETTDAASPDATHLPVEPARPYPVDLLKDAVQRRAGSLNPYQMSASDFDVTFITPVLNYGAQARSDGGGQRRGLDTAAGPMPLSTDFSNWSEYVEDIPPVLLVRVTPRLVEGFWTKVARAAVQTQGVALPPIKRFRSGFLRMTAFCGATEVTPVHPFKLERRASETEAIYEGLYVFDPNAIGPDCVTVRLVLYSEKEPGQGDSRVVDPKVIQQIWRDFAPYRDLK
jgi:S1-C subfamily serine protease